jgi:hypothetical protein
MVLRAFFIEVPATPINLLSFKAACSVRKPEIRPRQRITQPLRQRNGLASRDSANHERPRQDWIEIAVPALAGEETFALRVGPSPTRNQPLWGARKTAGATTPL